MSLGRRATPRLRNVGAQRLTGSWSAPKAGIGGCPVLGAGSASRHGHLPKRRGTAEASVLHYGFMIRRRLHRLTASFFVVVSLLFSQLALAYYVCPGQADAAAMAEATAAGEPCEGMDQAQPTLCHQHSAGVAQAFEVVKVPAPSLPAIVQVLVLPLVLDAVEAVDVPVAAATSEGHPPPDPLFLSTLRLRI